MVAGCRPSIPGPDLPRVDAEDLGPVGGRAHPALDHLVGRSRSGGDRLAQRRPVRVERGETYIPVAHAAQRATLTRVGVVVLDEVVLGRHRAREPARGAAQLFNPLERRQSGDATSLVHQFDHACLERGRSRPAAAGRRHSAARGAGASAARGAASLAEAIRAGAASGRLVQPGVSVARDNAAGNSANRGIRRRLAARAMAHASTSPGTPGSRGSSSRPAA